MSYENGEWLPTLIEIEKWKTDPDDADYWRRFGWDALDVPSDCPLVSARMAGLGVDFLGRYGARMVSYETMELWQAKLQYTYDRYVHVFERMYRLYDQYFQQLDQPIQKEVSRRIHYTEASGSDGVARVTSAQASGVDAVSHTGTSSTTGSNTGRHADTPDGTINLATDYGDEVSHSETADQRTDDLADSTTYGRKDDGTDDTTTTYGRADQGWDVEEHEYEGSAAERINEAIDKYRNIDDEFLGKFENMFLNIWWY